MRKILVIEDNEKLGRILKIQLEHEGYYVENIENGLDALNLVEKKKDEWSLILLDLNLPGISGEVLCKKINSISKIPIIIMSAKGELEDKISLFDMGAKDYVVKPFDFLELSARIRVHILAQKEVDMYKYLDLEVDEKSYTVKRGNDCWELSKMEFDLLKLLVINSEMVLTRDKIIDRVWGWEISDNLLDSTIKNLRKKIDKDYEIKYLHTIRGVGYVIKKG